MFTRQSLILLLGAAIAALISWAIGYLYWGHIGAIVALFLGEVIFGYHLYRINRIYKRTHPDK